MGHKIHVIKMLLKRAKPEFQKVINKETINHKSIKSALIKKASPTIIFSNGFGMGMKYWDEIFLEIAKTNTVFAYNRNDNKNLKQRITLSTLVEDLRNILSHKELKPPYILVGHSFGGLVVQYFLRKYPKEIKGIILVDSTHPQDFKDMSTFPKKMQKQFKNFAPYFNSCGDEILTFPTCDKAPVISLVATHKKFIKQYPKNKQMIDTMLQKQEVFHTYFPTNKLLYVDSGHNIPYEKPDVVIKAIKTLINVNDKNSNKL